MCDYNYSFYQSKIINKRWTEMEQQRKLNSNYNSNIFKALGSYVSILSTASHRATINYNRLKEQQFKSDTSQ